MIAETGHEHFSIRELARRAGVAQKTLYNAFGNKEGIVSSAIVQFAQETIHDTPLENATPTLEHTLMRMIYYNSRHLRIQSYIVAVMAINNSTTVEPAIRETVRNLSREPNRRYGVVLARDGQLAPHITPEIFAERVASFIGVALTDWCIGVVTNRAMIGWVCESYLIGFSGLTVGKAKAEAEQWLSDLRANSRVWDALIKKSLYAMPKKRARAAPSKSEKVEASAA